MMNFINSSSKQINAYLTTTTLIKENGLMTQCESYTSRETQHLEDTDTHDSFQQLVLPEDPLLR